jgi:hypothetical protein
VPEIVRRRFWGVVSDKGLFKVQRGQADLKDLDIRGFFLTLDQFDA